MARNLLKKTFIQESLLIRYNPTFAHKMLLKRENYFNIINDIFYFYYFRNEIYENMSLWYNK